MTVVSHNEVLMFFAVSPQSVKVKMWLEFVVVMNIHF